MKRAVEDGRGQQGVQSISPQVLYAVAGNPTHSAYALRRKAAVWTVVAGGTMLLVWMQLGVWPALLLAALIAIGAVLRFVVFTSTTQ